MFFACSNRSDDILTIRHGRRVGGGLDRNFTRTRDDDKQSVVRHKITDRRPWGKGNGGTRAVWILRLKCAVRESIGKTNGVDMTTDGRRVWTV